jgi:deazaflavin-dependent oxidoreductase (nitroreductase family)
VDRGPRGESLAFLVELGELARKLLSTVVDEVRQLACVQPGGPRVPAWWLNLEAAGHGVVSIRGERRRVRPRVATGEERLELWRRFARMYPALDDYPRFTERELPVVVLEPADV